MASQSRTASSLGLMWLVLSVAGTGWAADCNRNGKPDHEEIRDGTVADCDSNGIPDGCDITKVNYGLAAVRKLSVGGSPTRAAVADLDGDGRIDIATANDAGTVDILWGDGAGSFLAAQRQETPRFLLSIDKADIDGDGRIDLVGLTHNGILFVENRGGRQFSGRLNDLGRMRSLSLGDVDLDGDIDIALASAFEVLLLLNPGDGQFPRAGQSLPVGSDPVEAVLARVNDDALLDVVTANDPGPAGNVSVLLGLGQGQFQAARNYGVATEPASVAAGDLDGDGDADVVTVGFGDPGISLLRGSAAGTLGPLERIPLASMPSSAALADLDGDRDLDIVCTVDAEAGEAVAVLLNNGDGSFTASVEFPQEQVPARLALGDLDANGSLEVALPLRDDGTVLVLGSVAAAYSPDCDGSGVPDGCEIQGNDCNSNESLDSCDIASGASHDCNGNAMPDECEYDCNSTGVPDDCEVAAGRSPDCDSNGIPDECDLVPRIDFEPSPPSATRSVARHVESVDLDGDGHRDLLRVEPLLGASVLWGRGDGTFEKPAIISENPSIHAMTAGDLEGDGDLDVVVGDGIEPRVLTFFQVAPRSFLQRGEMSSSRAVHAGNLAAGDLDGDRDTDIVAVDGTNGSLSVAFNNGRGSLGVGLSVFLMSPRFLRLADLNADGKTDIVCAGQVTPIGLPRPIVILWNEGRSLSEGQVIQARGLADDADIADLDGDGDLDIAGVVEDGFTIAFQQPEKSFRVVEVFTEPGPLGIAAGDVDRDGDTDLVTLPRDGRHPGLLVFPNDGSGSFGSPITVASSAGLLLPPIVQGDNDEDGRIDFALERERECLSCPEENVEVVILNRSLPAVSLDLDGNHRPDACDRGRFRRGDASGDGALDIGDAVLTLRSLFQGGPAPGCAEATDADNDGKADLADPILVLDFLFRGGPPPAAPGPPPGPCGLDTDPAGSPGDLGCQSYGSC